MTLDKKLPQVALKSRPVFSQPASALRTTRCSLASALTKGTRTANGNYTSIGMATKTLAMVHGIRALFQRKAAACPRSKRICSSVESWPKRQSTQKPFLRQMGLQPGTVGYNNVMFNVLDLYIQAPAAVPKFIQTLAAKGFHD